MSPLVPSQRRLLAQQSLRLAAAQPLAGEAAADAVPSQQRLRAQSLRQAAPALSSAAATDVAPPPSVPLPERATCETTYEDL